MQSSHRVGRLLARHGKTSEGGGWMKRAAVRFVAGVLAASGALAALLAWRLARGPIDMPLLPSYLAQPELVLVTVPDQLRRAHPDGWPAFRAERPGARDGADLGPSRGRAPAARTR